MSKWLNSLQPWGAFLLRLVLGVAMVYNGWGKVIPAGGFHSHNTFAALDHHAKFVSSLGLPFFLGYVSALTEFIGGFLLILGLLTRFAALMIAGNMIVALLTVNVRHGYSGSAYTLSLTVIALMLLFYGGGKLALDRRIGFA